MTPSPDAIFPPLPSLSLPDQPLELRTDTEGHRQVFDALRRKWVELTPEEYVRQRFTAFLIRNLGYPAGLIANEASIRLNGTLKRCDTIIFGYDRKPLCVAEYKAPTVRISREVFEQILRYNLVVNAPYLIVSNGLSHFCAHRNPDSGKIRFMPEIPGWPLPL